MSGATRKGRGGAGAAEHRPEARGDPVRRAGVRRAHPV